MIIWAKIEPVMSMCGFRLLNSEIGNDLIQEKHQAAG